MFLQPLILVITLLSLSGNHGTLYGFLTSPLQPTINVQQLQPATKQIQGSSPNLQVTVGGNGEDDELQPALGYNTLDNPNATITVK